jgi:protein tyrosine phosphatase
MATKSLSSIENIYFLFVQGYNEGRTYIATQAPMENTVTEFWQMVWEQRCTAIVMLTELTDKTGQVRKIR